jgi:hypothetical protein
MKIYNDLNVYLDESKDFYFIHLMEKPDCKTKMVNIIEKYMEADYNYDLQQILTTEIINYEYGLDGFSFGTELIKDIKKRYDFYHKLITNLFVYQTNSNCFP